MSLLSIPQLRTVRARPAQSATLPEIWVLTHPARPSQTVQMLKQLGFPFQIYRNGEWPWPTEHPERRVNRRARPEVKGYALRQYRAFRGHQEILRRADPDRLTLVFEDDASLADGVDRQVVRSQLTVAEHLICEAGYDAVSLHGRELSSPTFSVIYQGGEYIELAPIPYEELPWGQRYFLQPAISHYQAQLPAGLKWHEGCLAYVIGPAGRQKWLESGHGHGLPCDLFLANVLETAVLRDSLFLHDDRRGSLIANTGAVRRQLTADGHTHQEAADES